MFLTYLPADILIRRVNFVGGNPMAAGHYRVEKRADNGFIYVLGGSAHYDTDSSSFDVTADDVFCLAKGARYEFDVAEGYRVLFVNFDLAEGEGVFGSGIAMRDARSRCRDDFRRLKIQYARKDATMLLSCRITLYNIIQALVSEQQKKYAPSSRYQPVQRAIAHMERHYADPTLSMVAVADAAGGGFFVSCTDCRRTGICKICESVMRRTCWFRRRCRWERSQRKPDFRRCIISAMRFTARSVCRQAYTGA